MEDCKLILVRWDLGISRHTTVCELMATGRWHFSDEILVVEIGNLRFLWNDTDKLHVNATTYAANLKTVVYEIVK